MLASFLLPTRKRPEKLLRAVRSIFDSAWDKTNAEVCIRMHSDDTETIAMIPRLLAMGQVRIHVGKPRDYQPQGVLYDEALAVANGNWVTWFNDDCVIFGRGWDPVLHDAGERAIALWEYHKLGGSLYHFDKGCPFFFMPRDSWGDTKFRERGDTTLWQWYKDQAWEVKWLLGMTCFHDRDEADCGRIGKV